jgi:uncharacterized membrane-anchored protein YjiN (DUF445 family)
MEQLLGKQLYALIHQLNAGAIAGDTLEGILDKNLHQDWLSILAENAANYIAANDRMVKEKVREESHFLIPGFVDDLIASKITKGIKGFLTEISQDPNHPQRLQITQRLYQLAASMKSSEEWNERFLFLKTNLLPPEKMSLYADSIWRYLKNYLRDNMDKKEGTIQRYLDKTLSGIAAEYLQHTDKSKKLDFFIQRQLFKLILRHRKELSGLISSTINNWESKSLSQKLELEVGKDLQFIRLNGTLVGGLVGLLIHAISLLI